VEVLPVLAVVGRGTLRHWLRPETALDVRCGRRVRALSGRVQERVTLIVEVECGAAVGVVAETSTGSRVIGLQDVVAHLFERLADV
jgi:hypothetical protein